MARNGNVLSVVRKSVCVVASQANQHIFVLVEKFFFAAEVLKLYIQWIILFMHRVKLFCPICLMGPQVCVTIFVVCRELTKKSSRNIYSQHIFFADAITAPNNNSNFPATTTDPSGGSGDQSNQNALGSTFPRSKKTQCKSIPHKLFSIWTSVAVV